MFFTILKQYRIEKTSSKTFLINLYSFTNFSHQLLHKTEMNVSSVVAKTKIYFKARIEPMIFDVKITHNLRK